MVLKRNTLSQLDSWHENTLRKPLLLKGARQVGKTSLLKEFGKLYFEDVAYFNFDEQPSLKQFFETSKDVHRIIQNLSLVHGRVINPQSTLIILDEIQECNQALNTLKYFCENAPEYAVAGAGSLLGITLGKESSFPVGKVDFLEVFPLSFSEFLANAAPDLWNYTQSMEALAPIPEIFYNGLLDIFKMYFISGGMPEAAQLLIEQKDIQSTQRILKSLINAYELDFSKHAPHKDVAKIGYVWNSIPAQLAKENKKFLYKTVKTGARAREYEDALLWLIQAGLVYKVHRCEKPNVPLSAYDDLSDFKLYLLDIGVLRRLAQLDPISIREGNTLFTEFKGAIAENYVLQSLIPQFEVIPRYWTSEGIAEVDFLIQYQNNIVPIEVKSGLNTRSKSLSIYHQKYAAKTRIRYSLQNLCYQDGILNIPLFMADWTKNLLLKIG